MNRISQTILVIIVAAMASGCSEYKTSYVRHDIVSVWKHNVDLYSVSIMEGNRVVDVGFIYHDGGMCLPQFTMVVDVPPGSNSWYEATYSYNRFSDLSADVIIHLHSETEINGAGWDHGKFGRGMTERIRP